MDGWKIFTGAAIGVLAVAAAPFTGGGSVLGAVSLAASLSGAGTIAAAVGAAAVGATVGACMGGDDDDKEAARKEGYKAGARDAKAETQAEIEHLHAKLQKAFKNFRDTQQHFQAIIAMEAVAVSCASCDGIMTPEEREKIDMFISGASNMTLPESVKTRIQQIYDTPPGIREAFSLAKSSEMDMEIFDEIISMIVHSDGFFHENEKAFVQAWHTLRAA